MSNQQSQPEGKNWFRRLAERFFPPPPPPPPPPERKCPPVDWHDEVVSGVEPDWVIDFGTAATVIGVVERLGEKVTPRFLVGSVDYPSDMVIKGDEVIEVGPDAFQYFRKNPDTKFQTSFKRHVELMSRSRQQDDGLHQLIADFIVKALEGKATTRLPGPTSHIAVSVPNSFNPTAVSCIRTGVLKALGTRGAANLSDENVRIVRESEAVAYLYMRSTQLTHVPVGKGALDVAPLEWARLQTNAQDEFEFVPEGPDDPTRAPCVLVFDVGGGTTDLTVFDTEQRRVVLNAGVPLGGSDVDKIMLSALLKYGFDREEGYWGQPMSRYQPLQEIRQFKDRQAAALRDLTGHEDEIQTLCDKWREMEIGGSVSNPIRDISQIERDFETRIGQLVELSVAGIFDLVPQSIWSRVRKILLTGRASQLERIRRTVLAQASTRGLSVSTVREPYHLKLAVACGCALVRGTDFRGRQLPSTTLGRRLIFHREGDSLASAIEFDAALPVSNERPTIWSVRVDRGRYHLFEYRTHIREQLQMALGVDQFRHLGLAYEALVFRATGPQLQHFLWHPVGESYYLPSTATTEWQAVSPAAGDAPLVEINPLTGLSLGFPDVV